MSRLAGSMLTSKRTKLIVAVFLSAVVVGASATTYAYFYASATATVRAPDVTLAAGTDASSTCTAYPCATVGVSSTSDTATVALSLFRADATFSPPPSTYFTNLVLINDATNPHTILSVSVSSVSSTSPSDFGKVIVYYCSPQCTFDSSGSVATGTVIGSFAITSTAGGTVFTGSQPIAAGGTHYIEVVAYAGSGASVGDTISFKVAVQWV